jgi:hypothetical protein
MKQVRCPECGRKRDINEFVLMAICPCCIIEMEEVDYGNNKKFSSVNEINTTWMKRN